MRVAIIGLGLIGGSIALELKQDNVIIGVDVSQNIINKAVERGVIDFGFCNIDQLKNQDINVIIVATPVYLVAETVKQVYNIFGDTVIITDVGSVKGNLVGLMGRIVGGHPMAGTENSGIDWATKGLFSNKYYCIVPYENTTNEDVLTIEKLIEPLNSKVVRFLPSYHDKLVANISHLPHAVAYSLSHALIKDENSVIAGSGFLDTTRIASSSPDFWQGVFLLNRENILKEMDGFIASFSTLRALISNGDKEQILRFLSDAKNIRDALKLEK